jgi:RND superfamily putative drug exporter
MPTNPLTRIPMRAARWSATHPWRAVGAWIAFVVVAVGLAMVVPTAETTDADYRQGESGQADAMMTDSGLVDADSENVLITGKDSGQPDRAEATQAAQDLTALMRGTEGVAEVGEAQWSPDGSAMLIAIQLAKDQDDVSDLLAHTKEIQADYPTLEVRQVGDVSLDEAIDERVGEDLASAETISLPVTLILMLIAFGALIAAGLPVLLAFSSVAATIGVLAPLSHLVHAEGTVTSMIVLIGMAVGVDYSLFYLKREREEREAGRTTLDAVEIAAQTSGHSILVSGAAVIAALSGLFLMGDATFNSLAVGSILVVGVAVLGSITVLPAMLVLLGHWVDRPRVPLLWRLNRRIGRGGLSSRLLAPVLKRPVAALIASVIVMMLLALPALGLRMHSGNIDTLPASITEVQTLRDLQKAFPVEGASATVVVQSDPADAESAGQALRRLEADAIATGDFVASDDKIRASEDGTTHALRLAMPYEESDERVDEALRDLRDDLAPAALSSLDQYAVGGGAAESLDNSDMLAERLPIVVGFVLLLTLLIMAFTFRSIPIAIVSTLLNLGSVGVSFGLLALVFQNSWAEGLLDFDNPGFVIDWIPVFVLVVLVGLSMDYHVFVVSRIREHVLAGMTTRQAVEQGVRETASVITSAAAVMISVFAIFATLSMLEMKMMGVGLSVAILFDATLVRLVMLPAILVLLGERAWWPVRPTRASRHLPAEKPADETAYELVR